MGKQPPALTQFKPGQVANPAGRPKGARNKLGEAFVSALHDDFTQHGAEAIAKVREVDPSTYMRVVAGLLPKEVKIERPIEEMSDDELGRLIDLLRAADRPAEETGRGAGASPTTH